MSCEMIWQALEMAYWAKLPTAGLTNEMAQYFWTHCVCMA